MPQQTNLNVSPYFSDFNPANDYHKVLFKPGYPVQARELSNLQSILQNQIEKFGKHFFKEGAKVIPGNTGYTQLYRAIQLNNTYQGVPVAAYADQLIGTKITGQTSGVTAVVDSILSAEDSERGNLTLYVNYISSSSSNNQTVTFSDGEELVSNTVISSGLLGNTSIAAGTPFAVTLATNAAATGSAFQIQDGVYFIRGNFVNVNTETLILDQYSNQPNYRVGLNVLEEIVNADLDETLNDNSQGYNNFAAPGADRLKITVSLFKKPLEDFDDNNFVELATITNGSIRTKVQTTEYNLIADEIARRTYAESGDYYVTPFDTTLEDSLNNNLGNRGIFKEGQFTYSGSTPSDDLGLYKVSAGKAFVKGYELETHKATFLDCPKPRDVKTLEEQSIVYNTGPTLSLNNVNGVPTIGIGNTYVVSLRDQRNVATPLSSGAAGNEVGVARIYDFRLESGSYDASNDKANVWGMSLYDVQSVTKITLNEPIDSLPVPTYITGSASGATAFLKDGVTAGAGLTVYETKGEFTTNEALIFDGIPNGRVATAITSYSISDVQSLYATDDGVTGVGGTFAADCVSSTGVAVGVATVSGQSGGSSVIRSSNPNFPGTLVKTGDLVQFTEFASLGVSGDLPTTARVSAVSSNTITVSGIATITGVTWGGLPKVTADVTDLKVLTTKLDASSDNTLYTELPKRYISNVDLTQASLTIRRSFDVIISGGQLSQAVSAGSSETFLPFDDERYALLRQDGTTESLDSGDVILLAGGSSLQVYNLTAPDNTKATLITTSKKLKPKAKEKILKKINSVIYNKSKYEGSGVGATTLNDGLTYGNYPYGTRVQDSTLSLNTPDIIEIHGVFESVDTSDPSAPKMILSSINSASTTTAEFVIGEKITGQTSGAVALYAERLTDSQISFLYKNESNFKEGETVEFEESKLQGVVTTLDSPSFEISSNYTFATGQEKTIYDYGTISRKDTSEEPTNRIRVYFSDGYYEPTDNGDITTVNSYNSFDYSTQIKSVDGVANSDIIDIRPRVSDYTVAENARSPLEFYGRSFNAAGNSATNILASDEAILTSFSHYLGRIDRIFLTKDGKFQVKYGTPAEIPEKPGAVNDALEIATAFLPPYLFNVHQADIKFLEHKRFRMVDIKQLENRIKNLEYYTALSLLEVNTANMFIPDSTGLNRFKSGFFVDNFSSFVAQEEDTKINNSIDRNNKEARPQHFTTSVDLIFGPVVDVDPNEDLAFSSVEGVNVRKQNDIVTLDYADVEWLKQSFATRSESVTPFLISFWQGTLELTPASDTWVDQTRMEAKIIQTEGNYAEAMRDAVENLGVDPQTGFSPLTWDSWETTWTGRAVTEATRTRTITTGDQIRGWLGQPGGGRRNVWGRQTRTVVQETLRDTVLTGVESRRGVRTFVSEQFDQHSVGDRVVNRDVIPFMRSRNVQFVGKRLKPLTRLYGFFDGVDVTRYCVPKLLEIAMTDGTFQVGENVIGRVIQTGLGADTNDTVSNIIFRVAQSNHREGPYDAPTATYPENPYSRQILPSTYSSTSTILNVDTFSLSNEAQGEYFGWVETGMVLTGESSGAEATITDVKLVSDLAANCTGSYYIPNPNNISYPRFETGTKVFTLLNDEENNQDDASTIAEEGYTAAGTMETVQENIVSVRNLRVEQRQEFQERNVNRTLGTEVVNSRTISSNTERVVVGWYDPLAQSFLVEDDTGVFLTKCDIFFRTKDDMDIPVVFQLRTMVNGFPTPDILPFSEIVLSPNEITTSSDGSIATTIEFKAPVFLEGGKEYAIALASNSTKYSVYISRIGENDLLTQTYISNQPYLGSLFKSQNASTWEASQWEDLKFTLYRADFIDSGSVEFYNPQLSQGNGQVPQLMPDSLSLQSREVRVGLGTTVFDSGLKVGNTVSQLGTNATGNLVGTAGTAAGPNLTIVNAGVGYTPTSGQVTYSGVNLVTITGNGRGAQASITVNNGSIVSSGATITSGGNGYRIGDVVGFTTLGVTSVGRDARLSIVSIGATNELILDGIQGNFVVGAANTVMYAINNAGVTTQLNSTNGGDVQVASLTTVNDGLHIKVNHKNHGMYSNENLVTISKAESDVKPTKLSVEYTSSSTSPISVDNASAFTNFENVGVGTTNVGYLRIQDEIIEYTSVAGNIIGGNIVRGSNPVTYPVGTPVYKYELSGVNLKRINKTHDLSDVTVANPITFDSYNIKLDMSEKFNVNNDDRSTDTGFPRLYVGKTKSAGGYKTRATQNMPYEIITPIVQDLTVPGTNLSAEVRTTTAQSLSGSETPFINAGFEAISVNQSNYLTTPRAIYSKVNEDNKLSNIPGSKSLNMRLLLNSVDSRVSPVVDAQRVSVITTSNRVNSVIENYATDSRVNTIGTDPTACQYISKQIDLENSATSLKILVAAHIHIDADIRAFYAISEKDSFVPIFIPFPGYKNLNTKGQVIDASKSDGLSDVLVTKVNSYGFDSDAIEFRDYTFTADQLPSFRSYRIKIVLTSTNQVYVPRMKDLRVLALA